ncbi:hypothetical protein ASE35_16380 [Lysobacter sp. Root916]|uniref:hypothetical protein n=1 Tax=Lysobacter sp. Root916 TaxID=1736606 RepID=UPI00070FA209|nr:hypothetical protein [Lysobacter sp. Root916]KRD31565.1 hypothetical protein ASE35_16380 [Lysobacter sp. Root916]
MSLLPARLSLLAPLLLLSACASSPDYLDTNAAVDARPECTSQPDRPGEPVPSWCERKQEVRWSDKEDKIDLKGKDDKGDDRR